MNRLGRLALAFSVCLTAQQISGQTPLISAGGVLNAASFAQTRVLAPGAIFSIFGTSLSNGATASTAGPSLNTKLAGARVLVNNIAAPLLYVSPGLINAQLPVELVGITTASVQVEVQSANSIATSPAVTVTVAPFSPGIFTLDENGIGPGVIVRASDFSQICPPGRNDCSANPAIPGEVVSIYMTGLGAPNGPTPVATVGNAEAQVLFSGPSEASTGVSLVDVLLPKNLSPGDSIPLRISIADAASNQVTISMGTAPSLSSQSGGPPPGGGSVTAIAIDPVHHYTVYAGTEIGGIFKSTDGGQIWTSAGLMNGVQVLAIDPVNPATLYAVLCDQCSIPSIRKSIDGGASWSAINIETGVFVNGARFANTFFCALAIDPSNPATIYAAACGGLTGGGVLKSTDGGASWTVVKNGFVGALAIDPANPATVYTGGIGGIFKSADGGASWTAANVGVAGTYVSVLVIDPSDPATLYAVGFGTGLNDNGIFKSTNGGASWSATSLPGGYVNALAIDSLNPDTVYAATQNGVFKSTDGGQSWRSISFGLTTPFLPVQTLAIDLHNPSTLYAGTNMGVFKSIDGGATWQPTGAN